MKKLAILCVICVAFFACNNNRQKPITAEDIKRYEEQNINVNREIVKRMQDTISQFVQAHNLEMQKTQSGLWYKLTPSGDSTAVRKGDVIKISYFVELLNGKYCYSSDSTGLKQLKVGQGGVESGLEEALLLMHLGDSIELLIPPHLAHGLMGDQNKIPSLAIIHYKACVKQHFPAK